MFISLLLFFCWQKSDSENKAIKPADSNHIKIINYRPNKGKGEIYQKNSYI